MTNVFIDGTDGVAQGMAQRGKAASALCVVHELDDGSFRFGGYAGMLMALSAVEDGYCGASRATNGTAELQASIAASLWMLQSGLTAFRYAYDATYAE